MPDDDINEPEVDEPDTPQEGDEPDSDAGKDAFDADRAREAIRKKNRENANLRERLKKLEPLAVKAQELENANKTETEKLADDRDGQKSRADTAEAMLRKLNVALEAAPEGATIAQVRAVAKRLSGDSDEELATDAEEMYELVGAKKAKVPGKPKENLRGGTDPDEPVEETDPRKLAEMIRRN